MTDATTSDPLTNRLTFPLSDKWVGILKEIEMEERLSQEAAKKEYEDFISDEYEEVLYVADSNHVMFLRPKPKEEK